MTTPITIRFGLQIPLFDYAGVADDKLFDRISSIATRAESNGFDSVWVMDHFYQIVGGRPADRMFEGYVLLGAIAARTSTVNLGTLVSGVTYRNPALLAKQATSLDVLSGGRAILGIGAAWNQREHDGYGFDFPPVKERLDRLEEAVQICRLMFEQESASFEGRHYRIRDALNRPRPIRTEGIPILIGGNGERRTLKLAATYADACNVIASGDALRAKLDALARHCDDAGRDPATICKTALRTLVVGSTAEEAARKGAAMRHAWGVTEDRYPFVAIEGDPATVAEKIAAELALGLDGMIFNMPDAHDLEAVELAGAAIAALG